MFPSSTMLQEIQCDECVLLDVQMKSKVLNGVLETTTERKIKLCSVHMLPDTLPPAPVELYVFFTAELLNRLQHEDDPLGVACSTSTAEPAADTVPQIQPVDEPGCLTPSTPISITARPCQSATTSTRPIRRRKTTSSKEHPEKIIHIKYPLVLARVSARETLNEAIKSSGMSRTNFFKWRHIAELQIVDLEQYHYLSIYITVVIHQTCYQPAARKPSTWNHSEEFLNLW